MKPVKLTAVFIHLNNDLIPIKKRSKLKQTVTSKSPKAPEAKKDDQDRSESEKVQK